MSIQPVPWNIARYHISLGGMISRPVLPRECFVLAALARNQSLVIDRVGTHKNFSGFFGLDMLPSEFGFKIEIPKGIKAHQIYSVSLEHRRVFESDIFRQVLSELMKSFMPLDSVDSLMHEVRTHLNSAVGFGEVLTKMFKFGSTITIGDRECEFLDFIVNGAKNAVCMTSNFLRLLNPNMDYIDIRDVFNKFIALHKTGILQIGQMEVELDDSIKVQFPSIYGAPRDIYLLFENLLSNALQTIKEKIEREGLEKNKGQITVRICVDDAKSNLLICISDNGCGIPAENKERVFEKFFTTKKFGVGTGLGLSETRDNVEKLGGEISFESEAEKGTTFTVKLPCFFGEH